MGLSAPKAVQPAEPQGQQIPDMQDLQQMTQNG